MFIFIIWISPTCGDCFTVTLSSLCVQSGEGARSPAVFAAIISYIRDILDVFGIELLHARVRVYELSSIYFLAFVLHEFTLNSVASGSKVQESSVDHSKNIYHVNNQFISLRNPLLPLNDHLSYSIQNFKLHIVHILCMFIWFCVFVRK